jgi:hypothetical protein
MSAPERPLAVEIVEDAAATPGDLVAALAALVLRRARQALATRPEAPPNSDTESR